MIRYLRSNTKLFLFVLTVLISPAFVLWGIGSYFNQRSTGRVAGRLGSKVYYPRDLYPFVQASARSYFLDILNELQVSSLDQLQGFTDLINQLIKRRDFTALAWQRIAGLRFADELAIKVTDKEVKDWIMANPLFKDEQGFRNDYYRRFLSSVSFFDMDPLPFEQELKDTLRLKKLEKLLEASSFATKKEFDLYTDLLGLSAETVLLYTTYLDDLQNIPVTESETLSAYQKNPDRYKKPLTRTISYLAFSPDTIPPLPQNNTSQPAEDDTVNPENKSEIPHEEQTADGDIRNGRAKNQERAEKAYGMLAGGKNLNSVAAALGMEVRETGFIAKTDKKALVSYGARFLEASFQLPLGEFSPVIEHNHTFYILIPSQEKKPHIPAYETIQQEIKEDLKIQKSRQETWTRMQNTLADMKETGVSPEEIHAIAGKHGVKTAGPLTIALTKADPVIVEDLPLIFNQDQRIKLFSTKPGTFSPVLSVNEYLVSAYPLTYSSTQASTGEKTEGPTLEDYRSFKKALITSSFYKSLLKRYDFQPE